MTIRKSLTVQKQKRLIKTTVVVLGDGETEESYLNRVNELNAFPSLNLKFVKGNENNYKTKQKEHAENPHVLLIIDVDNTQSGSTKYGLIQSATTSKTTSKNVFFNNYSFELWLLNHKVYFSKPITDKTQYDPQMKSTFLVDSWSNNKDQTNRLKIMSSIEVTDIFTAQGNVTRLGSKQFNMNPSSNLDDFIKYLLNIKA